MILHIFVSFLKKQRQKSNHWLPRSGSGKRDWLQKAPGNFLEWPNVLYLLTMFVVTQLNAFVKTHWIYLKRVNFTAYKLYLNKPDFKKCSIIDVLGSWKASHCQPKTVLHPYPSAVSHHQTWTPCLVVAFLHSTLARLSTPCP